MSSVIGSVSNQQEKNQTILNQRNWTLTYHLYRKQSRLSGLGRWPLHVQLILALPFQNPTKMIWKFKVGSLNMSHGKRRRSFSCCFSVGNKGMTPASHPLWLPLRESPKRFMPNTQSHPVPTSRTSKFLVNLGRPCSGFEPQIRLLDPSGSLLVASALHLVLLQIRTPRVSTAAEEKSIAPKAEKPMAHY